MKDPQQKWFEDMMKKAEAEDKMKPPEDRAEPTADSAEDEGEVTDLDSGEGEL